MQDFAKMVKAYPFDEGGHQEVYAKIIVPDFILVDDDKVSEKPNDTRIERNIDENEHVDLQITLINKTMHELDMHVFNEENPNIIARYSDIKVKYKPYFYEFFTQMKRKDICDLIRKTGAWYTCRFADQSEQSAVTGEISFKGDIFFSASPFQRSVKTLIIIDTDVPDCIKKDTYHTYCTKSAVINKKICTCGGCRYCEMINILIYKTYVNNYSIRVYNVGQGNCVYIHGHPSPPYRGANPPRILFDIGYSTQFGSEVLKSPYYDRMRRHVFNRMKPDVVILSHWDMDHIIGVCLASKRIFEKPWIAPDINTLTDGEKSFGACRLARYLHSKGKLFLIGDSFLDKQVFDGKSFELWRGNGRNLKLNRKNNSGLIIVLKSRTHALLPGDCEYNALPKCINLDNKRYEYMVVPHHGSDMQYPSSPKPKPDYEEHHAVISAGGAYGHPSCANKCKFLTCEMGYTVTETESVTHSIFIQSLSKPGKIVMYDAGHRAKYRI